MTLHSAHAMRSKIAAARGSRKTEIGFELCLFYSSIFFYHAIFFFFLKKIKEMMEPADACFFLLFLAAQLFICNTRFVLCIFCFFVFAAHIGFFLRCKNCRPRISQESAIAKHQFWFKVKHIGLHWTTLKGIIEKLNKGGLNF